MTGVRLSSDIKSVEMGLVEFTVLMMMFDLGREVLKDMSEEQVKKASGAAALRLIEAGWFTQDAYMDSLAEAEAESLDEELGQI